MRIFSTQKIAGRKLYTTKEVSSVIDCCLDTVGNMLKSGLSVVNPGSKPFLILGNDLKDFINKNNQKRKIKLSPTQFLCFKCKTIAESKPEKFSILFTRKKLGKNNMQVILKGECQKCSGTIHKFSTEKIVEDRVKSGLYDKKCISVLIDTDIH